MNNKNLGLITQGSLSSGLEMKLNQDKSVEDIRVGKFVVIEGKKNKFFSMITDLSLSTSNQKILLDPPQNDDFISEILYGSGTFGTLSVQPMLMLEKNKELEEELKPVKTLPSHFSNVFEADEKDFKIVFGAEDDTNPDKKMFSIGQPLDMDIPICIDLNKFVERSNGIFGKSGTGKSFLTRLILSGTIYKDSAVNLIFDMHNEYGWQARSENKGQNVVKGLKQLFNDKVEVFTLDKESTNRRGITHSHELFIPLEQIEIEDLALLKHELNLSEASIESAIALKEREGKDWLRNFLKMTNEDIDDFVNTGKGHSGSLKSLQRKLQKIESLKYVKNIGRDLIKELISYLENGKHVVLEFGSQNNLLSYMLATNIITRKIHKKYVEDAEVYNTDPDNKPKPRQLMITIEEAHKFLDPSTAKSTIFGTIAREMRKYFVTLLIVDQRPSGIDSEVLSQIGTRITALLNDDKDIDAVFTGVSGANTLKTVLSQMDPKQQALILGYSVPMPVVIRTRSYNSEFYRALNYIDKDNLNELNEKGNEAENDLWG